MQNTFLHTTFRLVIKWNAVNAMVRDSMFVDAWSRFEHFHVLNGDYYILFEPVLWANMYSNSFRNEVKAWNSSCCVDVVKDN
jgi:hypothetical protein